MRLLTLTAILLATHAGADDLVSDRPDFTESASAVAPGVLQVEAGVTLVDMDGAESWHVGEALLRYGLAETTELRMVLPSFADLDFDGGGAVDRDGFTSAAIGLKQEVAQGGDGRPELAVLSHVALPIGDEDVDASDTAVDLVLAGAWSLGPTLGLGMNVGGAVTFADETQFQQWASASLGVALTENVGVFVEGYSFTEELEAFTPYVDAGITRRFGDDVQLDARVGHGLDDADDEIFYGAGLVARF